MGPTPTSGTSIKLSEKEWFVAGLMLYWAEGAKTKSASVSNSDPRLIEFMMLWFKKFFGIPPTSFRAHLHIHKGQNENEIKRYWTKITGIPLLNFDKSFIKKEGTGQKKNKLYRGTIKIRVIGKGSTYLIYKIMGSVAGFFKNAINRGQAVEDWIPVVKEYKIKHP